jgi:hypothetical protein
MQVLEHALAVRNLARAQAARVGAVQAGRMGFEAHVVLSPAAGERAGQRETDDHEDHGNRIA